jgi:hypothetical protein
MRLRAALRGTEIRACFLVHGSFSAEDLAGYRGPKPQSESGLSPGELRESAAGSASAAGSCVSSATPCACRMWMSGRPALRPR